MKLNKKLLREMIIQEIRLVTESIAPPSPDFLAMKTGLSVSDVSAVLSVIEADYQLVGKEDYARKQERWDAKEAELKQMIVDLGGTPPLDARTF